MIDSLCSDPELVAEFILDSREQLSSLEAQLLVLENGVPKTDALHSIFRSFHTMKGLAGFLNFSGIESVAHEVEALLEPVRNGQSSISSEVVDVILETADYLTQEIERIESRLEGRSPSPAQSASDVIHRVQVLVGQSSEAGTLTRSPAVRVDGAVTKQSAGTETARFIKVETAKLDYLVDLVSELVTSQSDLRRDKYIADVVNPNLQRNLAQLSRITAEIQKAAMVMRMVPIGQLFRRYRRLVRDLTRKSGKQAELKLFGEDTELDRTLVGALADPLMHMIRNAVDHGIEPPAERIELGKSPVANLSLKAFHQSSHITVQLSDDGRGLNRERILRKAAESGLLPRSGEDGFMPDSEAFNLIFEPGLSTADEITELSGRGVGLDIVRREVQRLRGRIEIQSTAGQGTTFSIELPVISPTTDSVW